MTKLARSMIQVSPQIKLKDFERAGRIYSPARVALTGMRWMIEARSKDGHTLWKDFPANHGLYGPCICDPETQKVDGLPGLEWWSEPLGRLFSTPPVANTKIEIHRRRDEKSWIILNTLDTIFGHSFLSLLNANFYVDQFPKHGLVVIATPELMRFVPKDVAEVWEVHCRASETELWHESLDQLFQQRCKEGEVFVASSPSHPDPSRYDLRRFGIPAPAGKVNADAPRILFIYRGTRLWGGSWKTERNRLARLGEWLVKFWPKARLEIWGHATLPEDVPGWRNATRKTESDYDDRLMNQLVEADLVFGAHGSSMLLPSALAKLLIEFVPLDKQPSLLQDFLFDFNQGNLRQQIWRRRFLYGNSTLNDISPRLTAQLINAMISMRDQFDFYQSTEGSDPLRDPIEIEREYAAKIAPRVQAWRERLVQTLDLPYGARLSQFLRKIAAERD